MARSRLDLFQYGTTRDPVALGLLLPRPMVSVTVQVVDHTSVKLMDARPITTLPIAAIRRTATPMAGGSTITFDDDPGSTSRTFTGLLPDTPYTFTSAIVDTSGRVGPAATALATTAAAPVVVEPSLVFADEFDGPDAVPYVPTGYGSHPLWHIESSSRAVNRIGNKLKLTMTEQFHRMVSTKRIGGAGSRLHFAWRVKTTRLLSGTSVIPGAKVGLKWPAAQSATGFSKDDPRSVAGTSSGSEPDSPGSYIFVTGVGYLGQTEWARNGLAGDGYAFPGGHTKRGYENGTTVDRSVLFEWLETPGSFRVRYWDNLTMAGDPFFDATDTYTPFGHDPAFVWLRTDDADWEYDFFRVTDLSKTEQSALWKADFTLTLPNALGMTTVDGSNNRPSYGSIVAASSMVGGRAFRTIIPTIAHEGYKAWGELSRSDPDFPRRSVRMSHQFRITTMGGLQSVPSKLGLGLAGAPPGATPGQIASGGNKPADSWSARLCGFLPDYLKWQSRYSAGHPFCVGAYLYAETAGGMPRPDYGLEFLYRRPDGSYVTPVQGVVYRHDVEIVVNTPGVKDGRYTAWWDGVLVCDLRDVMWNPAGNDIPVSHLTASSFANDAPSSGVTVDCGPPTLSIVGAAAPVDPGTPPPSTGTTRVIVDQDFALIPDKENYLVRGINSGTPWYLEPGSGGPCHIRGDYLIFPYIDYGRIWTRERIGGPGKSVVFNVRSSTADIDSITANRSRSGHKWGIVTSKEGSIYSFDDPRTGSNADGNASSVIGSVQVFTTQTYQGYTELSQQQFGDGYKFTGSKLAPGGYTSGTEQDHTLQLDWLEGNLSTKVGKIRARVWRNGVLVLDATDSSSVLWGYSGFGRLRWDFCSTKIRRIKIEEITR